jgi:hypothetical protein
MAATLTCEIPASRPGQRVAMTASHQDGRQALIHATGARSPRVRGRWDIDFDDWFVIYEPGWRIDCLNDEAA